MKPNNNNYYLILLYSAVQKPQLRSEAHCARHFTNMEQEMFSSHKMLLSKSAVLMILALQARWMAWGQSVGCIRPHVALAQLGC